MGEYKRIITDAIRESVNNWIEDLQKKDSEAMITKKWRVIFPRGFVAGHNVLPVVTSSKKGMRLIAEVSFVLPDDLELDTDGMNLALKNEPYIEEIKEEKSPAPVEDSLDLLNDMVVGISEFLLGLTNFKFNSGTKSAVGLFSGSDEPIIRVPHVTVDGRKGNRYSIPLTPDGTLESIKQEMLKSIHLPGWFKTIESPDVREELLNKLSEGFYHYRTKVGSDVGFKEFFGEYTDFLRKGGKLYDYCTYKAKPVETGNAGWCRETYCSKKPYNAPCSIVTLKFGSKPEDL